MRYLSLFSGIEAASVAWQPLGWQCVGVAEIEPFPCAVLAHHYPDVPNLGSVAADDFIERAAALRPDVLVGGPPCQDFSVAGLRAGLGGDRGNLSLRWVEIVRAIQPAYVVTENVPGWLSVNGGHAFGTFLAGLVGHDTALVPPRAAGGRWTNAGMVAGPDGRAAWRILDAQFFGLAQRRKRVFVVLCPRDGTDPAAVLFEPASLRRDTPPRREAGERPARCLANGTGSVGGQRYDGESEDFVVQPVANTLAGFNNTGQGWWNADDTAATIRKGDDAGGGGAIAFSCKDHGADVGDLAPTLRAMNHSGSHANAGGQVAVAFTTMTDPSAQLISFDWQKGNDQLNPRPSTMNALVEQSQTLGVTRVPAIAYKTLKRNGSYSMNDRTTRIGHGTASEANAREALRGLQGQIGAAAYAEWGFGVLASFQQAEILFSDLLREIYPEREVGGKLVGSARDGAEQDSAWALRPLWKVGCERCPPPQWRPSGQQAEQLAAALSGLPQQGAQATGFLRDLWEASEGSRLLQRALHTLEEAWRSNGDQDPTAPSLLDLRNTSTQQGPVRETLHASEESVLASPDWRLGVSVVRRLTPRLRECERLQGFPDDWTNVPYRGKPAADGPRYRALGNSFAVPVISWIGRRIAAVDEAQP